MTAEAAGNRTFAEIEVGEDASLTRTITREDVDLFATLSGDANPSHLDPAFAARTPLKVVTAHGLLAAGLVSNLLGNRLPGAGTVHAAQDLRFLAPVRVGDTLTVTVTVREKRPEGRLVVLACGCTDQEGRAVLEGTATVVAPEQKVTVANAPVPRRHGRHYEALIRRAGGIRAVPCAVAHPCERTALEGALDAAREGVITPILVAPAAKLREVASAAGIDLGGAEIVDVPHSHAAAEKAVELVRTGRAELLMKGSLHTDELMRAVLAEEGGLRTGRRISHVFVMDVPSYPEPLLITDAAINIFPDLETKADILRNAIDLHLGLGLGTPRVAILSAVETVNPKIPGTLDAAALCKMADRGQIEGGILDGPLALDNAVSPEAAAIKGITSEVAGRAQIMLVPDLEAGNMLAKNLTFLAGADAAGIVLGARVPIILASRADSIRTRLASCSVAALYAEALVAGKPVAAVR